MIIAYLHAIREYPDNVRWINNHRQPPCFFGFIFYSGILPEQEEVVVLFGVNLA